MRHRHVVVPHDQVVKPGQKVKPGEIVIIQYQLDLDRSYEIYIDGEMLPMFTASGGRATVLREGESKEVAGANGLCRIHNVNGKTVIAK